jgi:hypothetical protein
MIHDYKILESESDSTLMFALAASAPAYEFWDVYVEAPWLLEKYEMPDLSVAGLNIVASLKI